MSSGDGYNNRFVAILADFTRKERCVDDTIHYDGDLQSHWWRAIDFLSITGNVGIVFKSSKIPVSPQKRRLRRFSHNRLVDSTVAQVHRCDSKFSKSCFHDRRDGLVCAG